MPYLARGMVADRLAIDIFASSARANAPYTAQDMAVWQALGFTHVRVPIAYAGILEGQSMYWDHGNISTAATVAAQWAYIDEKIAQFVDAGFLVIPCPFLQSIDRIKVTQAGQFPATIIAALDAIVARYCNVYDRTQMMFELWNEPFYPNDKTFTDPKTGIVYTTGAGYQFTDYNAVHPQLIATVCNRTLTHTIIMDVMQSAKTEHLQYLTPPVDPRPGPSNLIVSVHKYDPIALVNQGAGKPITPAMVYPRAALDPGPAVDPYWADEYDYDRLLHDATTGMQIAKDWSVAHNQRIYFGEIGSTCFPNRQARLNLHVDLLSTLKSFGVGWAMWAERGVQFGWRPDSVVTGNTRLLGAPGTFYAGYDMDMVNLMLATK